METTTMTAGDLSQDPMMADKKTGSMFEIGLRPTYAWASSDVDATGGYGLGIHLRKAFDHIFSVRLDGLYAATSGDDRTGEAGNRRFENRWSSGTVFGVMTLNNLKYEGGTRNTNIHVMAGGGANTFRTAYQAADDANFDEDDTFDGRNPTRDREFGTHFAVGTGINFRLSPRFNVGAEYQAIIPLGNRSDLIDGYGDGNFRDVMNAASVSLNFNLGNPTTQLEPPLLGKTRSIWSSGT